MAVVEMLCGACSAELEEPRCQQCQKPVYSNQRKDTLFNEDGQSILLHSACLQLRLESIRRQQKSQRRQSVHVWVLPLQDGQIPDRPPFLIRRTPLYESITTSAD